MILRTLLTFCVLWMIEPVVAGAAPPPALILSDPSLPAADTLLARDLSKATSEAGYAPTFTTVDQLMSADVLSRQKCALLVLPQSRSLPTVLAPVVEKYLRSGGHLLALGAPAWSDPLVKGDDGRWVSVSGYGERRALEAPPHVVYPFSGALTGWSRSSDHTDSGAVYETVDVAANGHTGRALHSIVTNLQGWDTYGSPATADIFRAGESVTVFSARGGARTRALAVEWEERDGARWIATVPLTEKWQRFSLPPSAFKSWSNSPDRAAKGFNPQNAAKLKIGLAYTHTGQMSGRHEYWISSVGLSPTGESSPEVSIEASRIVPLDTLTPAYKFFQIHGQVTITSNDPTAPSEAIALPAGLVPLSSSPRPQGSGFNKGRTWRWMPVLEAHSKNAPAGEWRGCPATLVVHTPADTYPGSAWLVFAGFAGSSGSEFYRSTQVLALITRQLKRVRDGVFLLDAGSDNYCYSPGQQINLGARSAAEKDLK